MFELNVEGLRLVKRIRRMVKRGYEYKQIDELLELPEGPDGDSYSYHINREFRRLFVKRKCYVKS